MDLPTKPKLVLVVFCWAPLGNDLSSWVCRQSFERMLVVVIELGALDGLIWESKHSGSRELSDGNVGIKADKPWLK